MRIDNLLFAMLVCIAGPAWAREGISPKSCAAVPLSKDSGVNAVAGRIVYISPRDINSDVHIQCMRNASGAVMSAIAFKSGQPIEYAEFGEDGKVTLSCRYMLKVPQHCPSRESMSVGYRSISPDLENILPPFEDLRKGTGPR